MSNVKKNLIYNSLYQLFAIAIPLITTPYLSRILGANGIGEYSYAYSIAYYFVMFIKLGLENYGNRTIAQIRNNKEILSITFWNIFAMQVLFGIAMTIFYILYCIFFSTNSQISWILMLFVISGMLDINWFFFGLEQFKITVSRNFIIKILTTFSIFIFIKSENDTYLYTIIMVFGMFLNQIMIWPFVKKYVVFSIPVWSEIKKHMIPNIILFIPVVAISLYKTMDKIMLGYLTNTLEVGLYESSEKIIQIPMALITSLGTVMLPRMSNVIHNSNGKKVNLILQKSIYLAMFLSTSLGFGIMSVAKTFVPWFYGEGFNKCISLFLILLPSCMFLAFANVIRTQFLIPNKEDKIYIKSVFLGAALNLLINAFLIPKYGAFGAAIGTLIAEASVCIYQCISVRHKLPIYKLFINCVPFILAGLVMFIIVSQIEIKIEIVIIKLSMQIMIGIFAYFLALFCFIVLRNKIKKGSINNEITSYRSQGFCREQSRTKFNSNKR